MKNKEIISKNWNISEKNNIEEKINKLNQTQKQYFETVKSFNLKPTVNIASVLNEYALSIYDKVFSSDIKAQIQFDLLEEQEQKIFKGTYINEQGLNRNKKIETIYAELLNCYNALGLAPMDSFSLAVNYFTFEDTPYVKVLKNTKDMLKNLDKYFGVSGVYQLIQYQKLSGVYDIETGLFGDQFPVLCNQKMSNQDTDYFSIVKKEIYDIC